MTLYEPSPIQVKIYYVQCTCTVYCNTRMFYNTTLYICNVSEFSRLDSYTIAFPFQFAPGLLYIYIHVSVLFILYLFWLYFTCWFWVSFLSTLPLRLPQLHVCSVLCTCIFMYMTYRDRWGNSVQVGGLGIPHHS